MKSVFCISLLSICLTTQGQVKLPTAYGADVKTNYIRTWEAQGPQQDPAQLKFTSPADDVRMTTQFFDGLGRLVQTVSRQSTPSGVDMVLPAVYDSTGREHYKYLPFAANSTGGNTSLSDGLFKFNPFQQDSVFSKTQYPGETYFYNEIAYEASPLNRVLKTYAAGNSWAQTAGNRPQQQQYLNNAISDSVRYWTISFSAGSLPQTSKIYSSGRLIKSVTIDEDGRQMVEYKDLDGKVVLKKVQLAASPGTAHVGWLNTYYVYDSLANLRFVMQPKAVEWLMSNSWNLSASGGTQVAAELCFRYEYDLRQRMIIKKIPGAGEVWMVYDARDRLVMTQDSTQRSQRKWLITRFDGLNRPDSSVLITDNTNYNNLSYHLSQASSSTNYPDLGSYASEVLTITNYDSYVWASGSPAFGLSTASQTKLLTTYTAPEYAVAPVGYPITRGLITGTKTKVLDTTIYLTDLRFYDDHGRTIQTQTTNYTGGIDTVTTQYNFSGQPLRVLQNHQKSGGTAQHHDVLTKMRYDASLRLKAVWKNVDGAAGDQLIDSMQYNDLGQLRAKYLGNALDSLVYDYNIRGWMTGINRKYLTGTATNYFGLELGYNNSPSGLTTYTAPQFNGNIAGSLWKGGGDGVSRKYDFAYDKASRLASADFTQYNGSAFAKSATIDFSVPNITYDANGNILTMAQNGYKVGGSSPVDQLKYSYAANSNKLQQVYDSANDVSSKLGDFHYSGASKLSTDIDYTYDYNGNLITDKNKGIRSIHYNYQNLPDTIRMTKTDGSSKGNIIYRYDAGGNKIAKIVTDSSGPSVKITRTLYIQGFQYQNDTLQSVGHEEGRIRWAFHRWTTGSTGYKWEYDFFEKDHLGNTREVLTQQRDTAQYLASMEAAYRNTENALFYNIGSTNVWSYYVNAASGPNPFGTAITNPNDSVCRISGSTPKEGPAIILKVMAGDTYKVGVNSFWKSGQTSTGTTDAITEILSSLANGLIGVDGGMKGTYNSLSNTTTSPLLAGVNAFRSNNNPTPPTNPKAYLNYIALDDQFNYDQAASGAKAVGGADKLDTLLTDTIRIKKNGYLYIYLSNETKNIAVFFDNLSITHYSGPLLEENAYYPFGLSMAGISDMALKAGYRENKFRYNNGAELHNKEFSDGSGLEMYETHFRQLDIQLGRWWQIDPKPSLSESPYSSMLNNPIKQNDPLGDTTWLYGADGHSLGVIPDRLNNQIHYMNTKNDKAASISTTGLKDKQITALAKAFRSQSIAFMGSGSVASLQKIYNDPKNKGLESLFVGQIGADKEIKFTQIEVPNTERAVDKISDPEKWVENQMASSMNSIFSVGHIHPLEALLAHEKEGGYTMGGKNTEYGLQRLLGFPSYPKDYTNQAGLNRTFPEAAPPYVIGTPVGFTLYKAGEFPGAQQYYLNKQFKN